MAQAGNLGLNRAQVLHGLRDIARAGLALGTNHGRTLGDAAQRLTQVGRATHEWHVEVPLIDVVDIIGRAEHLGLIDEVHTQLAEDLSLHKVADAGLGHDRDVHRLDDALN